MNFKNINIRYGWLLYYIIILCPCSVSRNFYGNNVRALPSCTPYSGLICWKSLYKENQDQEIAGISYIPESTFLLGIGLMCGALTLIYSELLIINPHLYSFNVWVTNGWMELIHHHHEPTNFILQPLISKFDTIFWI